MCVFGWILLDNAVIVEVSLFDDQYFTPTYIPDLIKGLNKLILYKVDGIFHIATMPVTTPYEFGCYVADKIGEKRPNKGSIKEFIRKNPQKALRPIRGGLIDNRLQVGRNLKDAVDEALGLR